MKKFLVLTVMLAVTSFFSCKKAEVADYDTKLANTRWVGEKGTIGFFIHNNALHFDYGYNHYEYNDDLTYSYDEPNVEILFEDRSLFGNGYID